MITFNDLPALPGVDGFKEICKIYSLNSVEKARLKGLIKKYGSNFSIERKSSLDTFNDFGFYISPFDRKIKNSEAELNVLFHAWNDLSINIFYKSTYSFLTSFAVFGKIEQHCLFRFEFLNKIKAKVIVDKVIWDKAKKAYYPKFAILDSFNNVHDIYDYV